MNIDNNLNLINKNSINMIYSNIIYLFIEYNISSFLDNTKIPILNYLKNIFTNINDVNLVNQNINNIKEIIKKFAKVKLINENFENSKMYMKKDIELYFNNFCQNITSANKKISKNDLFVKFKNSILTNCKIQDPNYIFNESIIIDDVEIKFIDIEDKLYELFYTTDISKFVDMYICNNTCECTQERLCNLKNEILNILYSTLSYKPTNIIMSDSEIMNNTVVDDIEIYNRIHNFLTSKTFDVYSDKTFPQIYLPY